MVNVVSAFELLCCSPNPRGPEGVIQNTCTSTSLGRRIGLDDRRCEGYSRDVFCGGTCEVCEEASQRGTVKVQCEEQTLGI